MSLVSRVGAKVEMQPGQLVTIGRSRECDLIADEVRFFFSAVSCPVKEFWWK